MKKYWILFRREFDFIQDSQEAVGVFESEEAAISHVISIGEVWMSGDHEYFTEEVDCYLKGAA